MKHSRTQKQGIIVKEYTISYFIVFFQYRLLKGTLANSSIITDHSKHVSWFCEKLLKRIENMISN